jgi:ribonuclease P protein component
MIRLAVDRNRLRRRLRESVREARPALEAFDIILRVRRMLPRADIRNAVAESRELLAHLCAAQ